MRIFFVSLVVRNDRDEGEIKESLFIEIEGYEECEGWYSVREVCFFIGVSGVTETNTKRKGRNKKVGPVVFGVWTVIPFTGSSIVSCICQSWAADSTDAMGLGFCFPMGSGT